MKKITLLLVLLAMSFGYSQSVLEDFEGTVPAFSFFDGAATANVVTDPAMGAPNGKVLQLITNTAGNPWQGTQMLFQGNQIDLTTNKTITIKVYSDVAQNFLAKVVNPAAAGPISATDANYTTPGQWQTLTFDFADNIDGTGVANDIYAGIVFYPAWENLGGSCNNGCYSTGGVGNTPAITLYLDDISGIGVPPPPTCTDGIQNQGETGTDCGGPCSACPNPPAGPPTTPPARAAANVVSIYGNAYMQAPTDGYQTFGSAVVSELDFMGNTILSTTTPDNGSGFQYQYFGTMPQFINLSAMTNMHIDFYFEGAPTAVGTVFIVIAQASDGTNIQKTFDVTALASSTWHEMDIPFASFDGFPGYARNAIQQVIVQVAGANGSLVGPFYVDNLYFHNNTTLGVEDFNKTSFSLYPNPTQDNWTVKTKNENMSSIKVFDILGKNVLSIAPNTSEATIDGSGLKSGLYFAQIETEAGTSSLKLVKN